jgi:hypothetical protein
MTAPETNADKRPEAAVEYGVRYREAPPFWRGRGKVHVGAVSDGSLEAAEYGARAFMTIGFRGVQVIQRNTPDGPWTLHHKVNPGRLLARKLTNRVSRWMAGPAVGSRIARVLVIVALLFLVAAKLAATPELQRVHASGWALIVTLMFALYGGMVALEQAYGWITGLWSEVRARRAAADAFAEQAPHAVERAS